MGEMVSVGNGPVQGRGYLARPRREPAPGVLLFHPWWGLNAFMKELADRLSAEGYVVLAPEYVPGRLASTVEEAEKLASGVDWEYASGLSTQAVDYLLADDGVAPKKLAAIGFSLGASPAVGLAGSRPDAVRAVVLFYGAGEGDFQKMQAIFQGHYAEHDAWESPEWVAWLKQQLEAAGRRVEFYTYPGTGHWFFESDRPDAYDKEAAAQAWERTLRFLKEETA
jgi:carboxymethylenebutenolidase